MLTEKLDANQSNEKMRDQEDLPEVVIGAQRHDGDIDMTDSDDGEDASKQKVQEESSEEEDHEELSDVFQ